VKEREGHESRIRGFVSTRAKKKNLSNELLTAEHVLNASGKRQPGSPKSDSVEAFLLSSFFLGRSFADKGRKTRGTTGRMAVRTRRAERLRSVRVHATGFPIQTS
jgi:hypothetical protein